MFSIADALSAGMMASYLEQLPKHLAARRKGFAAAAANPALLPSCWTIVRTITGNCCEYMRNAVIGGCTFPDRPIYLSADDSCFINFGATPSLLRTDYAWIASERKGGEPPASAAPELSSGDEAAWRERLFSMCRAYGDDHAVTRIYNLESWLQEMYRDCLDVDYAEELQRNIDRLNAYMEGVPRALAATGLHPKMTAVVLEAFKQFKTITGSSHQLERDKMSFTDKRNYVNTAQLIDMALRKADEALGSAAAGRSPVRELFGFWKDANYEMMHLTRQLRALWAGTNLDGRIQGLAAMFGAVLQTLNRCAEEDLASQPQLPVYRADSESPCIERFRVVDAFDMLMAHDFVLSGEPGAGRREARKFGPLSVIIAPGDGRPRYCREIRSLHEPGSGATAAIGSTEQAMYIDRRIRYPMNCIVVPTRSPAGSLLVDMADAWLEFHQSAYAVVFKNFLDESRNVAPALFSAGDEAKPSEANPHHARRILARLVAYLAQWMRSGAEPPSEECPDFSAFRDWIMGRIGVQELIVPFRHRPMLALFSDASPKRRIDLWRRCLGPRYVLDRQLLAVCILQRDWNAIRDALKYLPIGMTRGNTVLENAFAKAADASDPLAEHKALALFRRFMTDDPDLKSAMVSVDSQVAIEMETIRNQAESLGRNFQYDQMSIAVMRRQASTIQEKRNAANLHIDQYLTGLMYAIDGNFEAAVGAMSSCLTSSSGREAGRDELPPDGVDVSWFEARFAPKSNQFERKKVPGLDASGTLCHDFIYYNLGRMYLKLDLVIEARMCFRGFLDSLSADRDHLYIMWAEQLARELKQRMAGEVTV